MHLAEGEGGHYLEGLICFAYTSDRARSHLKGALTFICLLFAFQTSSWEWT